MKKVPVTKKFSDVSSHKKYNSKYSNKNDNGKYSHKKYNSKYSNKNDNGKYSHKKYNSKYSNKNDNGKYSNKKYNSKYSNKKYNSKYSRKNIINQYFHLKGYFNNKIFSSLRLKYKKGFFSLKYKISFKQFYLLFKKYRYWYSNKNLCFIKFRFNLINYKKNLDRKFSIKNLILYKKLKNRYIIKKFRNLTIKSKNRFDNKLKRNLVEKKILLKKFKAKSDFSNKLLYLNNSSVLKLDKKQLGYKYFYISKMSKNSLWFVNYNFFYLKKKFNVFWNGHKKFKRNLKNINKQKKKYLLKLKLSRKSRRLKFKFSKVFNIIKKKLQIWLIKKYKNFFKLRYLLLIKNRNILLNKFIKLKKKLICLKNKLILKKNNNKKLNDILGSLKNKKKDLFAYNLDYIEKKKNLKNKILNLKKKIVYLEFKKPYSSILRKKKDLVLKFYKKLKYFSSKKYKFNLIKKKLLVKKNKYNNNLRIINNIKKKIEILSKKIVFISSKKKLLNSYIIKIKRKNLYLNKFFQKNCLKSTRKWYSYSSMYSSKLSLKNILKSFKNIICNFNLKKLNSKLYFNILRYNLKLKKLFKKYNIFKKIINLKNLKIKSKKISKYNRFLRKKHFIFRFPIRKWRKVWKWKKKRYFLDNNYNKNLFSFFNIKNNYLTRSFQEIIFEKNIYVFDTYYSKFYDKYQLVNHLKKDKSFNILEQLYIFDEYLSLFENKMLDGSNLLNCYKYLNLIISNKKHFNKIIVSKNWYLSSEFIDIEKKELIKNNKIESKKILELEKYDKKYSNLLSNEHVFNIFFNKIFISNFLYNKSIIFYFVKFFIICSKLNNTVSNIKRLNKFPNVIK